MKSLLFSLLLMMSATVVHASEPLIDFTIYPGNNRAFVLDLTGNSSFPYLENGSKAAKLRFYYSTTSFQDVTAASNFHETVILNDDSIENRVIPNLINGNTYFFKVGAIDQNNKLVYLTDDQNCDPARHTVFLP